MLRPYDLASFPLREWVLQNSSEQREKLAITSHWYYGSRIDFDSQSKKITEEPARRTFDQEDRCQEGAVLRYHALHKTVHYQGISTRISQNGSVQASLSIYHNRKGKQAVNEKNEKVWAGLDVSKATFSAAIDNEGRFSPVSKLPTQTFPRSPVGAGSFLKWAAKQIGKEQKLCIIMETTGHYSKDLAQWLYEKQEDLHITIQNGRMISDFIKSLNLNKTDDSDAQAIARFGSDRNPAPTKREDHNLVILRDLERERTALIESKCSLEHRTESLQSATARKVNGRAIAALTKQIEALDREIKKLVIQNPEMHKEIKILVSIPGVAFISAANLIAEYGSLKQYTARELSQISGLAPRLFHSGSSVNKSYLGRRGSKRARQILYLDSIVAVSKIPYLQDLFNRIVARGKCKMCARCACMRKLLLIMRALVVQEKPFDNKILENFRKSS